MATTEVTGTVDEQGGVLTVGEGKDAVKYVKETDLLTAKESLAGVQTKLDAADKTQSTAVTEAETKAETARQATIRVEADVERLTDEIKGAGDNKEKVTSLTTERDTAIEAGKTTATALLELRREVIVTSYGVPKETVAEKTLDELKTFEEALKSVGALKSAGNLAIGGDSGNGASALEGVPPMELARRGYESSNKSR